MENAQTLGTILTVCKLRGNFIIFKQCRMITGEKSTLEQNCQIDVRCHTPASAQAAQ
jgi:hypothetical protein